MNFGDQLYMQDTAAFRRCQATRTKSPAIAGNPEIPFQPFVIAMPPLTRKGVWSPLADLTMSHGHLERRSG